MGGHISVGVRRKDGSFRTMGVWTNPLKYYVLDKRFLEGGIEPIDEFFARYLREDKEGDSFGGPQDTTPGEYGYVLIDEIDRVVMNWSHYNRLNSCRLDEVGIEVGRDLQSFSFMMDDESVETRETVKKFMVGATGFDREARMWGAAPFNGPYKSDDELAAYIMTFPIETVDLDGKILIRGVPQIRFTIGSPSWTFVELNHFEEKDFAVARAHVERCVKLTAEEAAAWDEEFKYMFRQEEES